MAQGWAVLPADVLSRVLSFMSQSDSNALSIRQFSVLRLVCSSWNSSSAIRWIDWDTSTLEFRSARTASADNAFATCPARFSSSVQRVTLADAADLSSGFGRFCRNTAGLTSLSLTNCAFRDPVILSECVGPQLKRLELVGLPQVSGALLTRLSRAAPNVARLKLENCGAQHEVTGTDADGGVFMSSPLCLRLPGHSNALCGPLLDVDIRHGCESWLAGLTHLGLAGCTSLTDDGLGRILAACVNLQELDLSRCRLVGGKAPRPGSTGLTGLWAAFTHVDGAGHDDDSTTGSAYTSHMTRPALCHKLTKLSLSGFGNATTVVDQVEVNGLAFLTAVSNYELPPFPRLQALDLSWCKWVGDDVCKALGAVLGRCSQLTELSLHACTRIGSDGLEAIRHGLSTGAGLQAAGYSSSYPISVTDASFGMCKLKKLDIGQIGSIWDKDVADLLSVPLSRLTHLDVGGCPHIGPLTYASMGRHCPLLTDLNSRLAVSVGGSAVSAWLGAAQESLGSLRREMLEQRVQAAIMTTATSNSSSGTGAGLRPGQCMPQAMAGSVGLQAAATTAADGPYLAFMAVPSGMAGAAAVQAPWQVDTQQGPAPPVSPTNEAAPGHFGSRASPVATPLPSLPATPGRATTAGGQTPAATPARHGPTHARETTAAIASGITTSASPSAGQVTDDRRLTGAPLPESEDDGDGEVDGDNDEEDDEDGSDGPDDDDDNDAASAFGEDEGNAGDGVYANAGRDGQQARQHRLRDRNDGRRVAGPRAGQDSDAARPSRALDASQAERGRQAFRDIVRGVDGLAVAGQAGGSADEESGSNAVQRQQQQEAYVAGAPDEVEDGHASVSLTDTGTVPMRWRPNAGRGAGGPQGGAQARGQRRRAGLLAAASSADLSALALQDDLSGLPSSTLPLSRLDWWRAMEIGDGACKSIASYCPNLRHIVLDGCELSLTDAGVVAIAGACPLLEHISLYGCPLTDTSLRALARAPCAKRLGYIDLAQGLEYTRAGLETLFKGCTSLHTVKLQRCSGVCNGSLRVLVGSCPMLRVLTIRGCGMEEGQAEVGVTTDGTLLPPGQAAGAPEPVPDDRGGSLLTSAVLDVLGRATLAPHHARASTQARGASGGTVTCVTCMAPTSCVCAVPRAGVESGGRLAFLGIGAVPAFSLSDYARLIEAYATHPSCGLAVLKISDGCTADQVERLEGFVRGLLTRRASEAAVAVAPRAADGPAESAGPTGAAGEAARAVVTAQSAPPSLPYLAQLNIARARYLGQTFGNPGATRGRGARHRALLRLEYLISGLKLEWRATASVVA